MENIILLAVFIIIAFVLQIALSMIQRRHFNKSFVELRRKGKGVIGKKRGWFSAGTIVLIQIDETGLILDARLLQGITVFSKFRTLSSVLMQNISTVANDSACLRQENILTKKAVINAKNNYLQYLDGKKPYIERTA